MSSAHDVLSRAISRGVPAYNRGDHASCRDVYARAALSCLEKRLLKGSAARMLREALEASAPPASARDGAWALREAFDVILDNADRSDGSESDSGSAQSDSSRSSDSGSDGGAGGRRRRGAPEPKRVPLTSADRSLLVAVRAGNEAGVRTALEAGASANAADRTGEPALGIATRAGCVPVVQALLDAGADKDGTNRRGTTALVWAAIEKREEVAATLIAAGADLNRGNRRARGPLSWAAAEGGAAVVRVLLAAGAAVEAADKRGFTALHFAAHEAHLDTLTALLDAGAAVDARNKNGSTPLFVAALAGAEECVRALAARGADVNAEQRKTLTRPLHIAASDGHAPCVAALLELGADAGACDKHSATALHHAAREDADTVAVLLAAGADARAADEAGDTPMHLAAKSGTLPVLRLLLEHGLPADVSRNNNGTTPAMWAALAGEIDALELLLDAGADIEAANRDGTRPLSWAAVRGHEHCLALLLSRGADPCARDSDGQTPLHNAAHHGEAACIALLLAAQGVDVDAVDKDRNTALHFAAEAGDLETVRALLDGGANRTMRNAQSRTPADRAADASIKSLLRKAPVVIAPPPIMAAAPAPAVLAVPAEIADFLARINLSDYTERLVAEHRLAFVSDMHLLDESDLTGSGLSRVEARRLLAGAKLHAPSTSRRLGDLLRRASGGVSGEDDSISGEGSTPRSDELRRPQPAPAGRGAAVMLSYRVTETGDGGDRSVFALQAALQARGYSAFVGESAIQGGAEWPEVIQHAVTTCRAFVALCSPSYGDKAKSLWTYRELTLADRLGKPLLPVWHSGPYPPPGVTIFLNPVQRIPRGNFDAGYVAAGIAVDTVADQLVAVLRDRGVFPDAGLEQAPAQLRATVSAQ